jgi:hypothetical protein
MTTSPTSGGSSLNVGDIVTVRGYGGWAEVLNLVEDGLAFGMYPKYIATVRFGVHDKQVGCSKQARRFPMEFGSGRLTKVCNADGEEPGKERGKSIDDMSEEELIALLDDIEARRNS